MIEGYYMGALRMLASEQPRWQANYDKFQHWSMDKRLHWIKYIELQADDGLPMAQELMAKALWVRMTR